MYRTIRQAIKNKVVWYVLTRYITYAIQFVVSLLCAAKMGPYYFGLWGFMLLILSYMQQINFGIPNSANILLVQERNNPQKFAGIESTAFLSQLILCIGVVFFAAGNAIWGYGFMEKYPIGKLFYLVCFIAMLVYIIQICTTVYRVKHQLSEIAFSQSIVPLLTLVALFLATGKELLKWFTLAYMGGYLLSLMIFLIRGKISLKIRPTSNIFRELLSKGIYLFIYNSCFYLIIITTRTVVSSYYQVEEFGFFTFAYTLADAVILLLAAITFLLFPKSIEKLHTDDVNQVKHTIKILRVNYMTLTHGLMYLAFIVFPAITWLLPKYSPALPAIYMVALALITQTISCGYPEYLMAQNKDRQIAFISVVSLIINILIAVFLASFIQSPFEYVIVATIISYWVFSLLSIILGNLHMKEKHDVFSIIRDSFPLRLLLPFVSSILIIVYDKWWLLTVPLILFSFLNYREIKEIYYTVNRLLLNPNFLDVTRNSESEGKDI